MAIETPKTRRKGATTFSMQGQAPLGAPPQPAAAAPLYPEAPNMDKFRKTTKYTTPGVSTQAQRMGAMGTALSTGISGDMFKDANGNNVNSTDYLREQAKTGSIVGMGYKNAAGADRENMLLGAGRDAMNAHALGARGLASGAIGANALRPASAMFDQAAGAGEANFQAATQAANQAIGVGQGMTQDVARLRGAADGTVPSVAAIQQQRGIADAINAQQSAAATARGGNIAGAMRTAAAAGSGLQSRGIADAAMLRANEMAAARAQLQQQTASQAQAFNTAAGISGAVGGAQTQRALGAAQGQLGVGAQMLGSRMAGVTAQANQAGMEYDRTAAAVATDRADQEAFQNYLLQMGNIGQGHAANIYNTDTQAAVMTRGQNLQLLGAGIAAGGAGFAQLGR